ncbi:MAG: M67 family metallopeptidase [Candidatus Omnitrophica bacterium]|nr:M67 family metallopeptidase [Candidatus Omnitrophota bacterium]
MGETLKIRTETLTRMIEHCRKEYPNEACGYLAGKDGVITRTLPMRNVDGSPTSYEMDGAEQAAIQRQMRQEGLEHLAIYHSHVATQAYPSRRDIDRATAIQDFFDGYYVLVTLKDPTPKARAFKVRDYSVQEVELQEI